MIHPLAQYRAKKKLSAGKLAKLAGTSRQTIHRIESGTQDPSLEMIGKLVEATGEEVTANDFLKGKGRAA